MRIKKHSAKTKGVMKRLWTQHLKEWIHLSKKSNDTPDFIKHMIRYCYEQL